MKTKKVILLIDAMSLLYRGHFAWIKNPRYNKEKKNTSALFGFTSTLMRLKRELNPYKIIVTSDTKAKTWRKKYYSEYKANRQKQPEDISLAFEFLPKLLEAWGIPLVTSDGYEADDILGTLSNRELRPGWDIYLVTADKDISQLIRDGVFWYQLGSGKKNFDKILDNDGVLEYWGIEDPKQVQDLLALCGDSSDNIPGVPSIGKKRAQKLLAQFKSIENLLLNIGELPLKQQELLEANKENLLLSKKLATIVVDIPQEALNLTLELDKETSIDKEKMKKVLDELDFQSIKKNLIGNEEGEPSAPPPAPHYREISELGELKKLLGKWQSMSIVSIALATKNLECKRGSILKGIALGSGRQSCFISIDSDNKKTTQMILALKPVLINKNIIKVGYCLKPLMHILKKYDLKLLSPYFDLAIAQHLLDPDGSTSFKSMVEKHISHLAPLLKLEKYLLNKDHSKTEQLSISFGGNEEDEKKDLLSKNKSIVEHYIIDNIYSTINKLIKEEGLYKLFSEIEMPLIEVLMRMEAFGTTINSKNLREVSKQLGMEIGLLREEIFKTSGTTFNIDSPKQLGEVLFGKLKLIEKPPRTKKGNYSTNDSILIQLAKKHPIVVNIRSYRKLQKLKNTYADALPNLIDPSDGAIHTTYHQTMVSTGRLSSSSPNLQNIPIRTSRGRLIRRAFVPRFPNGSLLVIDYSQIELRLMAHFSKDKELISTFKEGGDIHLTTASHIFEVKQDSVTKEQRNQAKMTNFSIIYGVTPFGLAQRLDIHQKKAKELINSYFNTFPGIKDYIDKSIEEARKLGYVRTWFGRKRLLPDISSAHQGLRGFAERNTVNTPIQGTQAELIKKAMIKIDHWMMKMGLDSRLILQVHDELVFDTHSEERELLLKEIPKMMCNALRLNVPIEVKISEGKNWLDIDEVKLE